jgi:hypothetical protein
MVRIPLPLIFFGDDIVMEALEALWVYFLHLVESIALILFFSHGGGKESMDECRPPVVLAARGGFGSKHSYTCLTISGEKRAHDCSSIPKTVYHIF